MRGVPAGITATRSEPWSASQRERPLGLFSLGPGAIAKPPDCRLDCVAYLGAREFATGPSPFTVPPFPTRRARAQRRPKGRASEQEHGQGHGDLFVIASHAFWRLGKKDSLLDSDFKIVPQVEGKPQETITSVWG